MGWLNKLDRKYGKYGIPNLTLYLLICYVIGYIFYYTNSSFLSMLTLNPYYILHGQVWRIITWVVFPPRTGNVILFALVILLFYYPIGTNLERTLGVFRYNVFIFGGILLSIIAAFILYFVLGANEISGLFCGTAFSTYYISISLFLIYACCYPDGIVLLYFVIPLKMKWMAIVYGALIAYDFYQYMREGIWFMTFPIIASILNCVIFYLGIKGNGYDRGQARRQKEFQKAMSRGQAQRNAANSYSGSSANGMPKHKCAICGRTEKDDPNLEFRFCSRCNGNYEYCNDHLFTHEHKK